MSLNVKESLIKIGLVASLGAVSLCAWANPETKVSAAGITSDSVVEASLSRLNANRDAQQQVDKVFEASVSMAQEFESELKLLDGLDIYNAMLAKQLSEQERQMQQIQTSIANASSIERQIMPLLVRMLDALEGLIELDTPFLLAERSQRIDKLKALLYQPDLTLAEKTRRVFEAYQIEMDYGSTIETYKGKLAVNNQEMAVEFLRIGRISLLYRDINSDHIGKWNKELAQWQPLEDSQYRRHINKGIRIAKEEIAPELLTIPLNQTLEMLP